MSIELGNMSLVELRQLKDALPKEIERREREERTEVRSELEKLARERGFSLDDLLNAQPSKRRSAVAPKFCRPDNHEVVWTGRGRQPGWVKTHLAAGGVMEDLLIPGS